MIRGKGLGTGPATLAPSFAAFTQPNPQQTTTCTCRSRGTRRHRRSRTAARQTSPSLIPTPCNRWIFYFSFSFCFSPSPFPSLSLSLMCLPPGAALLLCCPVSLQQHHCGAGARSSNPRIHRSLRLLVRAGVSPAGTSRTLDWTMQGCGELFQGGLRLRAANTCAAAACTPHLGGARLGGGPGMRVRGGTRRMSRKAFIVLAWHPGILASPAYGPPPWCCLDDHWGDACSDVDAATIVL